jgi:hypothetical protein
MTTCLPVRLDHGDWESAVFFDLGGSECVRDRQVLEAGDGPCPIGLEADVIECATAAIVMLRFEVATRAGDPLAGEVLLTPGVGDVQFETLRNLTEQNHLRFFFGDEEHRVIHSQQLSLGERKHGGYRGILQDAVRHDAMVRLSGRYDAEAAMREVTRHYATHVASVDQTHFSPGGVEC